MNKWIKLIISVLICQLAGAIGSVFTFPSIQSWYAGLQKPVFNPPNWIFGPVWITLYTLMGISLYIVWERGIKLKVPVTVFGIQLILNSLWSILFFGLHLLAYSLAEIIILWISIAFTIVSFFKVSKKAGLILLPYIVWVSLAMILNYYVMILN